MKVLLVVKSKFMESLGVMYVSAVAKQAGHECRIVSLDEMVNVAIKWRPQIIGMSIMTGDHDKFKEMKSIYHNYCHYPGELPTTIVGGPDPTFFPEGYDWANMIIPGDAENEVAELLGSDRRYPDLDSLPWPDRTDFPNMKIRDFITSRGCPFNCSYCYNDRWNKMFKDIPQVRTRSVGDVVREIINVHPQWVYFQDSCFGVNIKWMREFALQYKGLINIPYHCHLRPSQVTDERAYLLRESGCYSTRIALETASPRLRELINRGHTTNEETYEAAKNLRKYGVRLMIQNMLCLPTSTIEDDLNTLEVNIKAEPDYAWCSIFVPYPGTALGDMCVENGWYKGNYENISDSFFDHSILEVSDAYREQSYYLQKCFALCVKVREVPKPEELTTEMFPSLIHRLMRKDGDKILYGGII